MQLRPMIGAIALCAATLTVSPCNAQSVPSFYPSRPSNAVIHSVIGVLTAYGRGNKSGSFTINQLNGTVRGFYIGSPMIIDGSAVLCGVPPTATQPVDPVVCPDWPSEVVIGTTTVKVLYWTTTRNGSQADVSDTMTAQ